MRSAPKCMDITVDVGVLMTGSGQGNPQGYNSCHDLMNRIESDNEWMLALDKKGRIKQQYSEKMKWDTFGHHWLRRLANKDKIIIVEGGSLHNRARVPLMECHFDTEDYKYVETAASTKCKILTTKDINDYSQRVCHILKKKLKVLVLEPQECLNCY